MNFYKNNKNLIITVIILMIIAVTSKQFGNKQPEEPIVDKVSVATTTEPYKYTIQSNGIITFTTPEDFGLASNNDQLLINSYIPPCDADFDYCLYYKGTVYTVTNFESAGVRIKNRTDLKTVATCLNAQPTGYTGLKSTMVASTTSYKVSSFLGIGDAGAGHYSSGELFRLAYDETCHEFETRIGATRFANFPEGSIKEFSEASQKEISSKLKDIVFGITLKNGEKISF